MSVGFPNPWTINLTGGSHIDLDGAMDLAFSGIPTEYGMRLREIAPISISLAPMEIKPMDISFRLKEIPSIRAHLPLNYKVAVSLLGAEVFKLQLCGQGQLITEPYIPNPCERRATDLREVVRSTEAPEESLPLK